MRVPDEPRLYHITHVGNLASIVRDRHLWSHSEIRSRGTEFLNIGMDKIKARRLSERQLSSHPGLSVGECVPFNFCSRSVMLNAIHKRERELAYRGGQEAVVHLVMHLRDVLDWAESRDLCWAFTPSNAGAEGFADYSDLARLHEVDWDVVLNPDWQYRLHDRTFAEAKAAKQAEFLIEMAVPWQLVRRIGVYSGAVREAVLQVLDTAEHRPDVEVHRAWYH